MSNNTISAKKIFQLRPFFSFILLGLPFIFSACLLSSEQTRLKRQQDWADSILKSMTLREKIGQLFSIRAHSNQTETEYQAVEKLVRDYHVGGLCFFQGTPYLQAKLTNRYQKSAKIPLMVAIDGEWGLGMRLDSTMSFPRQMTLGAIQTDTLIYQMGKEIALQCLRIGVHVNFAPVVDVNNNAENPVIGDRSFGEDKENVARKGIAYMRGMQDNGLIANAKHFPGHGDTDKDSHYTLPVISHKKDRLENIELYPFKKLIENGLQSTMVAHLKIPALDSMQTTLSPKVISQLLQTDMNFKGLVFTDALEMKGVANYYAPGELDILALLAGNDVLLLSGDVVKAIWAIEQAVQSKRVKIEDIDSKVKKILQAKYHLGLHKYNPVDLKNLTKDINNPKAKALQATLFEKAMTVIKNDNALIPLQNTDSLASLAINVSAKNEFQITLDKYAEFEHFQMPVGATAYQLQALLPKLKNKKTVIVSLHNLNKRSAENYGIAWSTKTFLDTLSKHTQVIVSVFGTPYSLFQFSKMQGLVCAYEDNPITQRLVPQMLFGAIQAEGKLPVTSKNIFKQQTGFKTEKLNRLGFALPESVGLHSDSLQKATQIIQKAMLDEAMPGTQLLIAKNGKIVWEQNLGFTDYVKKYSVNAKTIYDVASLTKVVATLPAIMWLYERDSIKLEAKASDYLPELKGTNKENLILKDILTHQAGLIAYLPHYERTLLNDKRLNPAFYSKFKTAQYTLPVAEGIFAINSLEDSLWKWTVESDLLKKDSITGNYKYEYSDLGSYILKRIAEKILREPIENFVERELFKPLGMNQTCFNPLSKFKKEQIAPTETDTYFRNQTIQGFVHDQGACMTGGVGGHAGLFSTATDLSKYLQMLINGGTYGGRRYFKQTTIDLFTKKQFNNNHRGLGWDKVDAGKNNSYAPELASLEFSFGHSGFTGCAVWVDKEKDLLMILLSNRIHPSVDNKIFISEHIRRKVFNQILKGIF